MLDWEDRHDDAMSEGEWIEERISRVEELAKFLSGLMPATLGADSWVRWLDKAGSDEPPPKVRSARTSNRQALIENRRTIRRLEGEKERHEAKAIEAAEALEEAKGVEGMILLRLLGQKLAAMSGQRFTVGPAWTVLRAIAFPKYRLPKMMMDEEEDAFSEIVEFLERVGEPDQTATSIWRTLFFRAGDPKFESRLHVALAELCREFDPGPRWSIDLDLDDELVDARTRADDQERLEFLRRLSFDGDDPRPRRATSAH